MKHQKFTSMLAISTFLSGMTTNGYCVFTVKHITDELPGSVRARNVGTDEVEAKRVEQVRLAKVAQEEAKRVEQVRLAKVAHDARVAQEEAKRVEQVRLAKVAHDARVAQEEADRKAKLVKVGIVEGLDAQLTHPDDEGLTPVVHASVSLQEAGEKIKTLVKYVAALNGFPEKGSEKLNKLLRMKKDLDDTVGMMSSSYHSIDQFAVLIPEKLECLEQGDKAFDDTYNIFFSSLQELAKKATDDLDAIAVVQNNGIELLNAYRARVTSFNEAMEIIQTQRDHVFIHLMNERPEKAHQKLDVLKGRVLDGSANVEDLLELLGIAKLEADLKKSKLKADTYLQVTADIANVKSTVAEFADAVQTVQDLSPNNDQMVVMDAHRSLD